MAFAMNQRQFSMSLLAFGETNTRKRVKNIMRFRKKGKWMGLLAVLLVAIVGVVCLTNADANPTEKPREKEEISHSAGDQKDGETAQNGAAAMQIPDLDDPQQAKAETPTERALREAVHATMPKKVVEALDHGAWHADDRQGEKDGDFLLADSADFDNVTLRLDFALQNGKLVDYISKEYGFVDDMPEEKIDKAQARLLVQKFAEAFLKETIETKDLKKIKLPSHYDGGPYVCFRSKSGDTYVVQLNHNMVVNYSQSAEKEGDTADETVDDGTDIDTSVSSGYYRSLGLLNESVVRNGEERNGSEVTVADKKVIFPQGEIRGIGIRSWSRKEQAYHPSKSEIVQYVDALESAEMVEAVPENILTKMVKIEMHILF